ncbi:hypothetical protein AX14_012269 [Amanita brunnescens Koide BX004]|nr:hypothetical protein AX14_012269 [Amanita brunnescens Koide BX004]
MNLAARGAYSGHGTWYNVGLGNCGQQNVDTDPIVAISKQLYDQNKASNCNQWVQISANGKSVYAMVRDSCPGCQLYDLDMSPKTFSGLADKSAGRIQISWQFMDKSWRPP